MLLVLGLLVSFAENMGKNITQNFSGKYTQKSFHHAATIVAADALKTTSKRAIQKTAEATGHLIRNKIARCPQDYFTNR